MKIKVVQLSENEILDKGIRKWPVWEKGVSHFPWTYDSEEECYILEGEFTVESDTEKVMIKPGDFVSFPAGLSCIWDILKPVKKHYNFP